MRDDFALIPVIDLKDGGVVHARAGKRADYRPLETPFGLADDPVAIARALLAVTDSPILYVADLDAIAGTGHHFAENSTLPSPLSRCGSMPVFPTLLIVRSGCR